MRYHDRPVVNDDPRPTFDAYAAGYDRTLDSALSVTGEDSSYFARARVEWLKQVLDRLGVRPHAVLDYGCGVGAATPHFFDLLGVQLVKGVDVSPRSIDVARSTWGSNRASFDVISAEPPGEFDLAFCNGVFHHIAVPLRLDAVRYVHRALAAGGLFAFWENNPWNPGTQLIMYRCEFDRDAVKISAPSARRLLSAGNFTVLRTDYQFIFPSFLGALRPAERFLNVLPVGGQYQVLARKG